ncbi:zinc-binding dehydrogenase [Chloroflexota bacterium]
MPMPQIKPDEVLLKVSFCGICGSDVPLYDWSPDNKFLRGIPIEYPRIIGHEPSGIVAEVGANVQGLKPGDRVCADNWGGCGECYYCRLGHFNQCQHRKDIGTAVDGAMAEYVALPAFNLYKIPDSMSLDEAAVIQPLGVAVHGFETLVNFKAGDDILILGPGSIGQLEAMVARASGAGKVFVLGRAVDKQRLELASQMGFIAINNEEQSALNIVLAETNGRGVDVVFDTTSGGAPGEAMKFLKAVGQLVITAILPRQVTLDGNEINRREIIINHHTDRNPSSFYRAISLVANGRVDVKRIITHKLNLEDADTGFKKMQKSEGLKILLQP